MEEVIKKFLSISSGYGYGDGYGDGSGDGSGSGYGYGYGSGSDSGYGDGDGDGSGYGYGSGSDSGYGDGDGDGSGDGYDSGYGDGDGDGSGDGYGYGDGDGYGYGDGDGYGYGDGDGIKEYNHQKVYIIDGLQTLIYSVHGNYAIGKQINTDLTLSDCYIAKVGNYFAHGKTLKEARADATAKYEQNKPIEERIADFISQYPSLDTIAEHSELYKWHNKLTGSCTFGRDSFAKEHNFDKDNGSMTVREFINLTRNSYGGDIIQQLEKEYMK